MIINRTNQSSSVGRSIKTILGVGTITTGSDNANVDYTIILGENCK